MAVNLCTLLRVHTETGSYSVRLTVYLAVAPLKCHFYLSIQVSSFLSCWWYLSNYTPVSIIKQNSAERCLCAYQTDWHLYMFNRALILSDSCTLGSSTPVKIIYHDWRIHFYSTMADPNINPCFPLLSLWWCGFLFFPSTRHPSWLWPPRWLCCLCSIAPVFRPSSWLCHTVKHLVCCKMWAFISMNFVKKCFIPVLSGFWTRQWPHNIKEPCCGRWGCQSVQLDVF